MSKAKPILANIIAQSIFGCSYLFVRMALAATDQDVVKYLAFRYTIGFLFMTALILLGMFRVNYRNKSWKYLLLCGLFNPILSQVLETTSVSLAPVTQVAILSSTIPIVTLLLGGLVFREHITRKGFLFCCLSVFGVILTNLGPSEGGTLIGTVVICLFIVTLAFSRLFLRKAREEFNSFEAIYITTAMGALTFTAQTITTHAVRGDLSGFFDVLLVPSFAAAILYMGVCSCVIAFCFTAYSSSLLSLSSYAVLNNISTVVAILSGVVVLREHVTPLDLIGTAIILCGVIGANLSR